MFDINVADAPAEMGMVLQSLSGEAAQIIQLARPGDGLFG
jgi:hypothetical protein